MESSSYGPLRLSPTRPHDDFNYFEELQSDLTAAARMIRLYLGSRLVSARLIFGVLSREERFKLIQ